MGVLPRAVREVARETILRLWDPSTLLTPHQKDKVLANVILGLHRKGLKTPYTRRNMDSFMAQLRHKRKKLASRKPRFVIKIPKAALTDHTPCEADEGKSEVLPEVFPDKVVHLAATAHGWTALQQAFDESTSTFFDETTDGLTYEGSFFLVPQMQHPVLSARPSLAPRRG
jgi:hypothetical protein